MSADGYFELAGTCKEASEALCASDSSLRLVRGYYHCPMWGKREHWWCEREDGTVVDPTAAQFPTNGAGAEYEEFSGACECEQCGKNITECDAVTHGNYAFCSTACVMRCVGL